MPSTRATCPFTPHPSYMQVCATAQHAAHPAAAAATLALTPFPLLLFAAPARLRASGRYV
eukprot:scaffold2310_cov105-Isochrysis_galbana.AAC.3